MARKFEVGDLVSHHGDPKCTVIKLMHVKGYLPEVTIAKQVFGQWAAVIAIRTSIQFVRALSVDELLTHPHQEVREIGLQRTVRC